MFGHVPLGLFTGSVGDVCKDASVNSGLLVPKENR